MRSVRLARSFVVAALALSSAAVGVGCGDDAEPASVDVVVSDVAPGLGGQLERVEISMAPVPLGMAEPVLFSLSVTARGERIEALSARFRPLAESHVGRQLYRFRVVGFRGGSAYLEAQNRLVFVAGAHLTLPIRLSPACVGVACAEDETCDPSGACIDAFVPSCALVEGRRPSGCDASVPTDGPTMDAPVTPPPTSDMGVEDMGVMDMEPAGDGDLPDMELPDSGPGDSGPPIGCVDATECNDGLDCTVDSCVDGACVGFADDSGCDDGLACTIDACGAAGCTFAANDSACDDGNPCTDDRCATSGCVASANAATCEDGLFCNGADTCAATTCSSHAGNPCLGSTVCREDQRTCVGCAADADCPAPEMGPWSECAGFADECDASGTIARTVTTFTCGAGTCNRVEMEERMPCSRPTESAPCTDDGNGCTADSCASGVCAHPPRTGAVCTGGYCSAAGACVQCLGDEQCWDDDRCTTDTCDEGRCAHSSAMTTASFRTGFGLEGFCEDTGGGGYQRVEAGCFHTDIDAPMELHRGYVTFDTGSIPTGARVMSAGLRMCAIGGPGASLMELYPVVGVPIPLDCPGIFSIGPSGPLAATIPDLLGPMSIGVPAGTVQPGTHTQYGLFYPETHCDPGNWAAKRYSTSGGPEGEWCPADTPWWLDVTYCTSSH